MKNRGMGHIEIVLAFIIFIVSLTFALQFFNPAKSEKFVSASLPFALDVIEENASTDVIYYSVKINNGVIPGGNDIIQINLPTSYSPLLNSRVENYSGTVLPSKTFNNSGDVGMYVKWENNDYILIKLSDALSLHLNPPSMGAYDQSYYNISSNNIRTLISENKIISLNSSYLNNYQSLREQFNLNRVDFAFNLDFSEYEFISVKRDVPRGSEIFSDSKRVEVLRQSGAINHANLKVSVW